VLGETLAARCYGGQKLAMIGEKGRGAHEDPNRGWCGAAECRSSAGDEGEEQSRVELIGGDLLVQRGKLERAMSAVKNVGVAGHLL
jgi:hypothetical protein